MERIRGRAKMETLLKKDNLARYIISKFRKDRERQISPIKLQKSLYFLFAMWGGKVYGAQQAGDEDTEDDELYGSFNKYLFDADFRAWKYGPVEIDVYHKFKNREYDLDEKNVHLDFNSTSDYEIELAQDYIDSLLGRVFITSDFALVDISHEDQCWRNAIDKMNNDSILKEYANRKS